MDLQRPDGMDSATEVETTELKVTLEDGRVLTEEQAILAFSNGGFDTYMGALENPSQEEVIRFIQSLMEDKWAVRYFVTIAKNPFNQDVPTYAFYAKDATVQNARVNEAVLNELN